MRDPTFHNPGIRPITDELIFLKQAVNILEVAEELARVNRLTQEAGDIAAAIKSARTLVEEVIEAFTAYFAAQVGAT
jgi:hypothetical protein